MKVVIFCGGLGVRMGAETEQIPKPLIAIGGRPILWHIMQYYSSWGHREFILCLGHKGEVIKNYFLNYNEAVFNDFVLEHNGDGPRVELMTHDVSDWRITFVDTGVKATIGERLRKVGPYLGEEDVFLATYGDGVTDAPLDDMIDVFRERGKTALMLSVRPEYYAHMLVADEAGYVTDVENLSRSSVRINGGFFVFKREIVDLIDPGEDLVVEVFRRLIDRRELIAYSYNGFFGPMDTIKDRQRLETLNETGSPPWHAAGTKSRRRLGAAAAVARE